MSDAISGAKIRPISPVLLIGKGVLIETLRRREIYVVVILSLLYVGGGVVVTLVGIENPATANFLLNLGMSLAYFFAHILVILSAARQVPQEEENGTLYPLLAKPLRRSQYVIGKWTAVFASGFLAHVILILLVWLPLPKLQEYNSVLFIQTIILYALSLGLMAALGLCLSLVLSRWPNILLLGIFVILGGDIIGFIRVHVAKIMPPGLAQWLTAYIPNPSLLNLTTRYTDGVGPLGILEFFGLILYGVLFTTLFILLGIYFFQRRSL